MCRLKFVQGNEKPHVRAVKQTSSLESVRAAKSAAARLKIKFKSQKGKVAEGTEMPKQKGTDVLQV